MNTKPTIRDVNLGEYDTTISLAHATDQAIARRYEDFMIVDVDSHHYETESFSEIADYIDDPVLRHEAKFQGLSRGGINQGKGSCQEMGGRIVRYPGRAQGEDAANAASRHHADAALDGRIGRRRRLHVPDADAQPLAAAARGYRDRAGLGLQPLALRAHPVARTSASARCSTCPSTTAQECLKMVEAFADKPGVIGFMVTSTHYKACHDNSYIKTYAALQERGLPLAFHSASGTGTRGRPAAAQPLHGRACAGLLLAQHAAHDQLAHQRHAGAVSQAEADLDRERPRLGAIPDAASRQRMDDAQLRRAAAQAPAERLHARDVLLEPADGDGRQPRSRYS